MDYCRPHPSNKKCTFLFKSYLYVCFEDNFNVYFPLCVHLQSAEANVCTIFWGWTPFHSLATGMICMNWLSATVIIIDISSLLRYDVTFGVQPPNFQVKFFAPSAITPADAAVRHWCILNRQDQNVDYLDEGASTTKEDKPRLTTHLHTILTIVTC